MASIALLRGQTVLARAEAPGEAQLVYDGAYQPGDVLDIRADVERAVVCVDACVAAARVYLPQKRLRYRLPLENDNPAAYAPNAFAGNRHLISVRPDLSNEYRNLALNPADQRGETDAYPHATANVETRNESVFCARNVIDGLLSARGHGEWPYQSWGIGTRTDACLTVDFGRQVWVDAMALYLRADFPHDAYWVQGTVALSDGFTLTFPLKGMDGAQRVELSGHRVSWARLERLIKCDMPSAFPALRQWEIYGQDEKEPCVP